MVVNGFLNALPYALMGAARRLLPPCERQWVRAIEAELTFIDDDWAAVAWAWGGLTMSIRRSLSNALMFRRGADLDDARATGGLCAGLLLLMLPAYFVLAAIMDGHGFGMVPAAVTNAWIPASGGLALADWLPAIGVILSAYAVAVNVTAIARFQRSAAGGGAQILVRLRLGNIAVTLLGSAITVLLLFHLFVDPFVFSDSAGSSACALMREPCPTLQLEHRGGP